MTLKRFKVNNCRGDSTKSSTIWRGVGSISRIVNIGENQCYIYVKKLQRTKTCKLIKSKKDTKKKKDKETLNLMMR